MLTPSKWVRGSMLADAETGHVTDVLTERDDAWIDVHDELFWLDDGKGGG